MLLFKCIVVLFAGISISSAEMPALQAIFKFFGSDSSNATKFKDYTQMTLDELGRSRGQCEYAFYLEHGERWQCAPDDHFILHLLPQHVQEGIRKPPIMVKCLQPEPSANITAIENSLLIMQSVKEIVALLKPIGNATKRHEHGSCVIVFFYAPSSVVCAHDARYVNMLPLLFPTLRFAAIDAFRFPSFNTEFGIVGLPTLLLFHQGRPIVKFYSDAGTFHAFVTRHTSIKHVEPVAFSVTGPLPTQPIPQIDYVLILAWLFILLCLGNYFAKSRLCKQIVEMIKRNWRESEAQLEHN